MPDATVCTVGTSETLHTWNAADACGREPERHNQIAGHDFGRRSPKISFDKPFCSHHYLNGCCMGQRVSAHPASNYGCMFNLGKKNQFGFGFVSPGDDTDIEVTHVARESRTGLWTESVRLFRDIFLILVVFVLFGVFVVQPVVVEGTSMVPELHDGERLLVNKLVYYKIQSVSWGHISRGDIVVFWYPREPDKSYVKRVIGLPGETVEVRNGKVFIDGQELNEAYLDYEHNQSLPSFPPKRVDDHYYFVMGDNRDNSSDSRYWGLVPEKYVYGKAFFRYWKPSEIGFIEHGTYNLPETDNLNSARPVQEEDER